MQLAPVRQAMPTNWLQYTLPVSQVGPARPMEGGATPADFRQRLADLIADFEEGPPFTIQRLCELLLEPRKQYSEFDKLVG